MNPATVIHQLPLGPWDNLVSFVIDRESRRCAVVDPAWHAPSIEAELERLELELAAILCTHSHFDHVNRVDAVLEHHDVPVHMLREEVAFSGFRCENLAQGRPGDEVRIGASTRVRLLHTPGHTPGSTCYLVGGALVAGDTLFVDGCGRCDFVGGDPRVMYGTLKTLTSALPGTTLLYPGHDYGPSRSASLDAQLRSNPWLQHPTLADFVNHRMEGRSPDTVLPEPAPWEP